MFLLIDNYDSFTYNLVQCFQQLGVDPIVLYNDDPSLLDYAQRPDLEAVCISPGPSHPLNAGLCLEFLGKVSPKTPILGVCLGHQCLGAYAGARVEKAPYIMHGKPALIIHDGKELYDKLPQPMQVARYHSLIVNLPNKESVLTHPISITAETEDHIPMSLHYTDRPWYGIQYHPESILTPEGIFLLKNFVHLANITPSPNLGNPA